MRGRGVFRQTPIIPACAGMTIETPQPINQIKPFYPFGSKRVVSVKLLAFLTPPSRLRDRFVILAKAGTLCVWRVFWIPAFAGMTTTTALIKIDQFRHNIP